MARRYPLADLLPLFQRPPDEARVEVLARWFGAGGLLESPASLLPEPGVAAEYAQLRERWRGLGHGFLSRGLPRQGSRPWNAPERRLVGLFHHLSATAPGGWLKTWLAFLKQLDGLRDHPDFRPEAIAHLERMFATPEEEPWRNRVTFAVPPLKRSARLIGGERVVMLMVNAVLPFFLALARRQGDAELEKVLYRLYIVLPPEGANRRTRFMERRLAVLAPLGPALPALPPGVVADPPGFLHRVSPRLRQLRLSGADRPRAGCRAPGSWPRAARLTISRAHRMMAGGFGHNTRRMPPAGTAFSRGGGNRPPRPGATDR